MVDAIAHLTRTKFFVAISLTLTLMNRIKINASLFFQLFAEFINEVDRNSRSDYNYTKTLENSSQNSAD